ncbi:MAG: NADH-quinone oxidoreductase subunit E [Ignavibacteria bacterium GWC2_35_8]|nr:MAG: NADH-quinone oxidoreductase subunit E [Ignavibacteria bacterium GWC2_35_8]
MDFKFTRENLDKINDAIKRYPDKQAAVMHALWIAQAQNGWISNEVMQEIAKVLEINPEDILGVVTFYTMYHQEPVGKYHLQVCTNVSCMLRGAYDIYETVKKSLGIENMQVTADKKFSLEEVECMGSCGSAPMIAVNEDYYENLTVEKIEEILKSLTLTLSKEEGV